MIILDTNVVSEAMKPAPHVAVRAWLNAQTIETLYLSSVTMAELQFGIAALPKGKRQKLLMQAFEGMVAHFNNRVLAFDADAARQYADMAVRAKTRGRGLSMADGYIAAIAASKGFMVATRDTAPFEAVGVAVIDPWRE